MGGESQFYLTNSDKKRNQCGGLSVSFKRGYFWGIPLAFGIGVALLLWNLKELKLSSDPQSSLNALSSKESPDKVFSSPSSQSKAPASSETLAPPLDSSENGEEPLAHSAPKFSQHSFEISPLPPLSDLPTPAAPPAGKGNPSSVKRNGPSLDPQLESEITSFSDFRSAPSLQDLLRSRSLSSSPSASSSGGSGSSSPSGTNSILKDLEKPKLITPDKLDAIVLDKVVLDPLSEKPISPGADELPSSPSQKDTSSSLPPENPVKSDPRSRLLGLNANPPGDPGQPKSSGGSDSPPKKDGPPPPPSGEGDPNEEDFGGDGPKLSLAKPYCFLLPKSSPALECAKASVKAIVEEYARADVQVIPVFRWWGDDYPRSPGALEQAAVEACNLEKAFPWTGGGSKAGSVQAFVEHAIPNAQCGIRPPKPLDAAGCSNLCPGGGPSFSTVSQDKCSPGVSVHESGHSNCCGSQCKNEGTCGKNEIPGGCGLCLPGGGQNVFFRKFPIYLANKFDGSKACTLSAAALESIRQGAAPNPGYRFNLKKEYRPLGKKYDSIYGKNGIRKLLKGIGEVTQAPPKNVHEQNRGEGRKPATSDNSGDSRRSKLKNPTTYTPDQIRKMVGGD